ncbi:MAG: hypothetical protein ACK4ND_03835 [Cytophagaceae bacterium]
MHLQDFLNSSRIYNLNTDGTATVVEITNSNEPFCGFIRQLSNGDFAAVYKQSNSLFIQIGKSKWTIGSININYKHDSAGKTHFSITSGENLSYDIIYDSWWIAENHYIPGMGLPDDDEEDILAYIALINRSPEIQANLLKGWNNC